MSANDQIGPSDDLPPGAVTGVSGYAVGNDNGEFFAVSRRCRHFGADLAEGSIDDEGHLVCPWHQAAYDVHTGSMVRGPQGTFAKIPGLDWFYEHVLTRVLPLRRGLVVDENHRLSVRRLG